MARVMIDLDGVIYNFVGALRHFVLDNNFEPDDLPEATTWEFYEEWGLNAKGFRMFCDNAVNRGRLWNQYSIAPADREALQDLRKAGHTLHIITARSFGASPVLSHQQTADWLGANHVPYDTLTFAGDKTIIRTDFAIEDKRENYDALAVNGTTPFLLDRPWNQDNDGRARMRVRTMREFAATVLGHTAPRKEAA